MSWNTARLGVCEEFVNLDPAEKVALLLIEQQHNAVFFRTINSEKKPTYALELKGPRDELLMRKTGEKFENVVSGMCRAYLDARPFLWSLDEPFGRATSQVLEPVVR